MRQTAHVKDDLSSSLSSLRVSMEGETGDGDEVLFVVFQHINLVSQIERSCPMCFWGEERRLTEDIVERQEQKEKKKKRTSRHQTEAMKQSSASNEVTMDGCVVFIEGME